ncbi:hypothetical protein GQ44DRAFT_741244 [Phaeosphaeriaceae sp. PMI808]|nr:hypothetical protein GQ44DRAFT_741244 [Phaeosphaeriaceae sp. PMI808]
MAAVASSSSTSATSTSQKRPNQPDGLARSKRARYTAVACNECKKRKLKCIGGGEGVICGRCVAGGMTYVYVSDSSHTATGDKDNDKYKDKDKQKDDSSRYQHLIDEISILRQQVTELCSTVGQLTRFLQPEPLSPSRQHNRSHEYEPAERRGTGEPKEPHFVGHTRPAFSLGIARSSLTLMGIATNTLMPSSCPDSLAASPASEQEHWPAEAGLGSDCLLSFTILEIEDVESVYPFLSSDELAGNARGILNFVRSTSEGGASDKLRPSGAKIGIRDVQALRLALSTVIVIEACSKSELSNNMVESIERDLCNISGYSTLGLKELQLWTMLSIYYFHCDEDLLAWRTIGVAVRKALEMGLHRKESLMDNFMDAKTRGIAVRTFWCIYVLDRRWSFGTSLSFAFADRDIDPELPEPGEDFPYLQCLVGYGRLCSRVWDALPRFGPPQQFILENTVAFLEFATQTWVNLIPVDLQLRHPRLGLAPRPQPRVLHRLRALLYLRGNHTRMLIRQHHVLSSANIAADVASARLVVDIAQDTIQVLVHLNEASDIYVHQQNAFHYFLLSALAVILLAECHAPAVFAGPCQESYVRAVGLVKGFKRQSLASRRLWKCIKGFLPGTSSLGMQISSGNQHDMGVAGLQCMASGNQVADSQGGNQEAWESEQPVPGMNMNPEEYDDAWIGQGTDLTPGAVTSVPEAYELSTNLIGLFDTFDQATGILPLPSDVSTSYFGFNEQGALVGDLREISQKFHRLI